MVIVFVLVKMGIVVVLLSCKLIVELSKRLRLLIFGVRSSGFWSFFVKYRRVLLRMIGYWCFVCIRRRWCVWSSFLKGEVFVLLVFMVIFDRISVLRVWRFLRLVLYWCWLL